MLLGVPTGGTERSSRFWVSTTTPGGPCRSACPPGHSLGSPQLGAAPPLPTLQDVKRCLNALEELGTLQVTSQILQKNTDVVATLKKVRWDPSSGRAWWPAGGRGPEGHGLGGGGLGGGALAGARPAASPERASCGSDPPL